MGGSRLLLIEDDVLVREGVCSILEANGYDVRSEPDGRGMDEVLVRFRPDLAILDVTLTDGPQGFDLASEIRSHASTPVMFLTAADSIDDRIRGFDVGADDYLVKPFSARELVARIRAVLRRSGLGEERSLVLGDLRIDLTHRTTTRAGEELALTPTEYDILVQLATEPGRVWSKRDLLTEVWGFEDYAPHIVEVHVSSLRRKLEAHGPRVILTVRGGGYSFGS